MIQLILGGGGGGGLFTQHCLKQKTEDFTCILAIDLHHNSVLGAWKHFWKQYHYCLKNANVWKP